ncbi:MAG: hypothetical protein MP439_01070 [Ferrimicrobium sp.]|jgi:hypothetical protein|nr:hypothetical protein [Ferrimicrobium sp.]
MSNQLRFSGKSIEEALAKARATLGEGVRLVAAERVSKPGFVGKRVSFTVVVEPPTAPISAPGFAAALRNALVSTGPRSTSVLDADESDYRSVQDELARTYERTSIPEPQPSSVTQAPIVAPKIFRRDGKVTKLTNVASPWWSSASDETAQASPPMGSRGIQTMTQGSSAGNVDEIIDLTGTDVMSVESTDDTSNNHAPEDVARNMISAPMSTSMSPSFSPSRDEVQLSRSSIDQDPATGLSEDELVEAAQRAMTNSRSGAGDFLVDRIDTLVVDLSKESQIIDVRPREFMAETACLAPTTHLVAVVVPSAFDPIERFREICETLDISADDRFVLARRRREIPTAMLSSTNLVARSVVQSADAGGCTGVLVDAGQLRLLRGSFLDSMMAVVVAIEGTETVARLEREMSPCGQIDALWYQGDDQIAATLGIARLRSSIDGDDR